MRITIRYGAQLANAAGVDEETLELLEATGLSDALQTLQERHGPDFSRFIYDDAGSIHSSLLIAIDDRQVDKAQDQPLHDGAEVLLITPMAGG